MMTEKELNELVVQASKQALVCSNLLQEKGADSVEFQEAKALLDEMKATIKRERLVVL